VIWKNSVQIRGMWSDLEESEVNLENTAFRKMAWFEWIRGE